MMNDIVKRDGITIDNKISSKNLGGIVIESDRVYSSKLGTGIATVIESSDLAESMNVPNFNIQIKFKQVRSLSINYSYKNEIDLNMKLNELECF